MHWRFWLVYRKCRLTHCEFIIYLGSHRDVSFCFCTCHSEAETLTRLGFFPSTPIHPSTAFQFLLLDKLESLLLECQVPLKDFLAALRCYSILPFMLVINIWYVAILEYSQINFHLQPQKDNRHLYKRLIDLFEEYRYIIIYMCYTTNR